MEAMASLGHSSQLGYSFSSPYNRRGFCSSGQSASHVSVTYRAHGTKNVFASRAKLARQSDPEVPAERPELVARFTSIIKDNRCFHHVCNCQRTTDQGTDEAEAATDGVEETLGITLAIAVLKFYKREISQLLPGSCRYVPTCSEYSMQAYRTYGVLKGTILTAWRIARCNPLGGSGFDPPRWFGETKAPPL